MALPTLTPQQQDIVLDLDREVEGMHYRWKVFHQLFVVDPNNPGEAQARYDLTKALVPLFFDELRSLILDAAFLHVCRITEAAEKPRRGKVERSAVVGQLIKIVESLADPALSSLEVDLKRRHTDIDVKCAPLRKHRNKRISHRDLDALLMPTTTILPQVTIQTVDVAMEAIRDFVNAFQVVFLGRRTYYEGFDATDDGDTLIEMLKRAFVFQELTRSDLTLVKRLDEGPFGKA